MLIGSFDNFFSLIFYSEFIKDFDLQCYECIETFLQGIVAGDWVRKITELRLGYTA